MGKPWENQGKTIGKCWFYGILWDLPFGKPWRKLAFSNSDCDAPIRPYSYSLFVFLLFIANDYCIHSYAKDYFIQLWFMDNYGLWITTACE